MICTYIYKTQQLTNNTETNTMYIHTKNKTKTIEEPRICIYICATKRLTNNAKTNNICIQTQNKTIQTKQTTIICIYIYKTKQFTSNTKPIICIHI